MFVNETGVDKVLTDNNKDGNNNKVRNNSLERIWKLKFNE